MDRRDTVVIPESVALNLHHAGLGSRMIAAILDTLILSIMVLGIYFGIALVLIFLEVFIGVDVDQDSWINSLLSAANVLLVFGTTWIYYVGFEVFRNGQTPGKRRMGLQVVRDNGQAITLVHSGLRNIFRIIDYLPVGYAVGLIFTAASSRGKRLGDHVAGTVVVEIQDEKIAPQQPELLPDDETRLITSLPNLDPQWLTQVRSFMDERHDLTPGIRAIRARELVANLHQHISFQNSYPAEDLLVWTVQRARRD